jgi:hypothetical protein
MDKFSVEDGLPVTSMSIAITNLGPVSKSPLLREPIGIATCADSERDYWSVLWRANIDAINDMISTGKVTLMVENQSRTLPVKVFFFFFFF